MPQSPPPHPDLALLVHSLDQLINDRLEAALRVAGFDYVRPDHRPLLEALHTHGSLVRAAEALGVTGNAAREVASRLGGRRDYVRRHDYQRVHLTDRGRGALDCMRAQSAAIQAELREALGPLVLEGLNSVLAQSVDALLYAQTRLGHEA